MRIIFFGYIKLLSFYKNYLKNMKYHQAISDLDISVFMRQFATLIFSNVSLIHSCEILEKCQEKKHMHILIYSIKRELLAGQNLFAAFSLFRNYFDELSCQLIKIGEKTGKIEDLLLIIAERLESNLAFKRQMKHALFYPSIVFFSACFIILVLLLLIIPQFEQLFQAQREQLPLFTLFIFFISNSLRNSMIFLVPILIGLCLVLGLYKQRMHKIIASLYRLLLSLPLIRAYQKNKNLAHFLRNCAITFSAGLALTEALHLSAKACTDFALTAAVTRLCSKMHTGMQLHSAMSFFPYFPPLVQQMIKVGEESGQLENMLNKVADFFAAKTAEDLARLGHLLEPLIMLVLGVLIGGLVIGMYLPIFKLGTVL
jgi:type IV pilus assembly protein PilC